MQTLERLYDELDKAYAYFPNPKKLRAEKEPANGHLDKRPQPPAKGEVKAAAKRKKSK